MKPAFYLPATSILVAWRTVAFSVFALFLLASFSTGSLAAGPRDTTDDAAFTPNFETSFIIAPNNESAIGSYAVRLLGAGLDTLGGGQTMQVGFAAGIWYMRFTRGAQAEYVYDPCYSPPGATVAGPPDLTDRAQLPPEVLAGLDAEFDIGRLPRLIAWLEWARFCDVPLVFHLNGGPNWGEGWPESHCATYWLEQQDPIFCQWNEDDLLDPDNDASTFDMPAGDERSFATLSLASDEVAAAMGYTLLHRTYKRRNLEAAVDGILFYGSLPRYAGHVAAVTMDSEHHMNIFQDLTTGKRWYCDYNPIVIREYQIYLEGLYGDTGPDLDSNGDGTTFNADFGTEYLTSGNDLHPHSELPATWEEVDPPRNPNPALDNPALDPDRYWMMWTNFREEKVGSFVEDVAGWITARGVPPERIYSHQTSGKYQLFKNRVVPTQPPMDLAADFRAAELDYGSAGFDHYQPYHAGSGHFFFSNYRRVDPNWAIPEYNPFVIVPGQTFATFEQVASHVQGAYANGAHIICPHAWMANDYPVVAWTSWAFQNGLQGWSVEGDLTHSSGVHFQTTGPQPQLLSPPSLGLEADSVRLVTTKLRTPPGGEALSLFFQRTVDTDFDSTRVVTLPLKNMPTGYWDGWAEYAFDVGGHPLWTGTIERLRLDPVDAHVGMILIHNVSFVEPNSFSIVLSELVAANDGLPRPDPTPPSIHVGHLPFALSGHIEDSGFEVYGTGTDGDFDPAGDFESAAITCGGVELGRSILAPPPSKLGQWLVGSYRLALPQAPVKLRFQVGLSDEAPPSHEGVRFEVTLRDETRHLWHLADVTWREQSWSREFVLDLCAFAGQEITLKLRTHAVADTVGDLAAWGVPRLEEWSGSGIPEKGFGVEFALAVASVPGTRPVITLRVDEVGRAEKTRVTIQDISGRTLRILVDRALPSGQHQIPWDGCSGVGRRLPAGIYFVRAVHGDRQQAVRIVVP